MKRKYFSRGLGLGIFVTALLFAFGLLFYKPSLSDEEIKARAVLLGMSETSERRISSETSASSASSASSSAASSSASSASSASFSENPVSAASSAVPENSAVPEIQPSSAEPASSPAEPAPAPAEPAPAQNEPVQEEPVQQEPVQEEPAPQEPAPEPEPYVPETPSVPENPGNTDDFGLRSITISPSENSLSVSQSLYRAGIIDDPAGFNKYLEANGYDYSIQTGTFWISPNASYETIAHAITNH